MRKRAVTRVPRGLLAAALLAAQLGAAHAQPGTGGDTRAEPGGNPVRTGKERLSDKASDEQRVDDCKVPPERRGSRPRPDACPGTSAR